MIEEEEIVNGGDVATPGKEESSTRHQHTDVDEIELVLGLCLFCTCDAVLLVSSTTRWAKLG